MRFNRRGSLRFDSWVFDISTFFDCPKYQRLGKAMIQRSKDMLHAPSVGDTFYFAITQNLFRGGLEKATGSEQGKLVSLRHGPAPFANKNRAVLRSPAG